MYTLCAHKPLPLRSGDYTREREEYGGEESSGSVTIDGDAQDTAAHCPQSTAVGILFALLFPPRVC